MLAAAHHLIVGIVGFLSGSKSQQINYFFAGLTFIGAWWAFWIGLVFSGIIEQYPNLTAMSQLFSGYFGPFLLLFTLSAIDPLRKIPSKYYLFLLFGLFGTYVAIRFLTIDNKLAYDLIRLYDRGPRYVSKYAFFFYPHVLHVMEILVFVSISIFIGIRTIMRTENKETKYRALYVLITIILGLLASLFANLIPFLVPSQKPVRIAPALTIPGFFVLYYSLMNSRKLIRKIEEELQKARIDALEHSRRDLEQLNRAKSKALDHLSHELLTPLAVIQGYIHILKRKAQAQNPPTVKAEIFESLEKNLNRLSEIQQETDHIIRSHQELEKESRLNELDIRQSASFELIFLYSFTERILKELKKRASHRKLHFHLEGTSGLYLNMNIKILEETLIGLLKNAIENTPDEGMIRVVLEQKGQWLLIKVQDFGIGITNENQRHLFDGLFHTLDTDLYTSKKPYDFGAGGKGLDLLQIKIYGKRFGFDISVGSQRCIYLPTNRDLCPGKISLCSHCKTQEDCFSSGGSTFCLSFTLPA